MQGTQYSFTPSAADSDGDKLTFSISGLPSWATFNTANGSLLGMPSQADVGTYANISISVTDGTETVSLSTFSIQVSAVATGSASLSWTPPTQNTDGTPLTNLAGYKVYWGMSPGSYSNSVTLNNPGLSAYVVDQLPGGATWYFVVRAYNSVGVESDFSNMVSKTL